MAKAKTKTAEQLTAAIIQRANDGYNDQEKSGYPPFALAPWDDRIRWTAYLRKVILEVLSKELP